MYVLRLVNTLTYTACYEPFMNLVYYEPCLYYVNMDLRDYGLMFATPNMII